jgi:Glycosyl transferase family 2
VTTPLGSIVIPAHDEAAVIRRCLDALFDGVEPGQLEVLVACNGCSDDTAAIARSTPYDVTVLETATASKPVALRMADATATTLPRIYLDADVVLRGSAARAVLQRLAEPGALAARPPISYDSSRSTWPVRCYYRARARVPSVMNSLWGAGVYGLSATGRARFGEFPDVVAEDLFVDDLFSAAEIDIVAAEPVVVAVPRRVEPLMRILRRTARGNAAESAATPADRVERQSSSSTARDVLRAGRASPGAAWDAIIYLGLALTSRVLVLTARSTPRWERDDSSREA